MRLTKLQKLLLTYISNLGGEHVYISRTLAPAPNTGLGGYTWEGVRLSLQSLLRRELLTVKKESFYYLTRK